jgi:hypothetical protein
MVKVKNKHISVGLSGYQTVGPVGCRTNGLSDYSYAPDDIAKILPCDKTFSFKSFV